MSIYAKPLPNEGTDHCPTVFTAENVVIVAYMVDGKAVLGRDIENMLEWEGQGTIQRPHIKSGIGINKVRKAIKSLWDRMSKKAKAMFLASQYMSAVDYLEAVIENITNELGEVPELHFTLPSSSVIQDKWTDQTPPN